MENKDFFKTADQLQWQFHDGRCSDAAVKAFYQLLRETEEKTSSRADWMAMLANYADEVFLHPLKEGPIDGDTYPPTDEEWRSGDKHDQENAEKITDAYTSYLIRVTQRSLDFEQSAHPMWLKGERRYLSNFYECPVIIKCRDGKKHRFCNSEAAFQALKTKDSSVIKSFEKLTALKAKRAGRKIELHPDNDEDPILWWNEHKNDFMKKVIRAKFSQNPELAKKLVAEQEYIQEANNWGDTYWGLFRNNGDIYTGYNYLGKILMEVRKEAIAGELSKESK